MACRGPTHDCNESAGPDRVLATGMSQLENGSPTPSVTPRNSASMNSTEGMIVFEHTFINALSWNLHKLVKAANDRLLTGVTPLLGSAPSPRIKTEITKFLRVTSPISTWLK